MRWIVAGGCLLLGLVGAACSSSNPTAVSANRGNLPLQLVESSGTNIAVRYQSTPLLWSYVRLNRDWEATTSDGVCTFNLVSTLGELSSRIDITGISCAVPNGSSSFTDQEAIESAAYVVGFVRQLVGPAATNWVEQRVSRRRSHTGVIDSKTFRSIIVGVDFDAGQLSMTLSSSGT